MLQKKGKSASPQAARSPVSSTRTAPVRRIDSIRTMHDRSNGLGGGFAGYGIYPEYADYYAFHVSMIRRRLEECDARSSVTLTL